MDQRHSENGDVSLLLVFLTLTVLLLGALSLAVLAISNLRGVGDIAASSQAFYAVDTGIERGRHDYNWFQTCTTTSTDVPVAGQSGVTYVLTTAGDPPPAGSCPTVQDVVGGTRALCMEAVGKARDGLVRRRVTNDSYDASRFTNPCAR